jgi:hypothetical protein
MKASATVQVIIVVTVVELSLRIIPKRSKSTTSVYGLPEVQQMQVLVVALLVPLS